MTSTLILETLAREFSTESESVRRVLELLEAGLTPAHIGRHRRADTNALPEHVVRRMARRVEELTELDRRRGTIRRQLESTEGVSGKVIGQLDKSVDRFELEDLFLPYRNPEPEVQLALDRGLGALADQLIADSPDARKREPEGQSPQAPESSDGATEAPIEGDASNVEAAGAEAPVADAAPAVEDPQAETPAAESPAVESQPEAPAAADAEQAPEAPAAAETDSNATDSGAVETEGQGPELEDARPEGGEPQAESGTAAADDGAPTAEPTLGESGEADAASLETANTETANRDASAPDAPADGAQESAPDAPTEGAPDATAAAPHGAQPSAGAKSEAASSAPQGDARHHAPQIQITPELARLCAEFVSPDRGVHTEQEALIGAMRILADRLGRSTAVRGQVRKLLRKHGVLDVQPGSGGDKSGRHKALLKIEQPMKQVQGHRLIAIRQAQRDRAVSTVIKLDRERSFPTVRKALARRNAPAYDGVLDAVALVALEQRLLPMIEDDVRLELKERGDEEALRFVASHLREILLTSPLGRRRAVGVDVSPKGDYTFMTLDESGQPTGPESKLEVAGKEDVALAEELTALMRDTGVEWLACSHNRSTRKAVHRLRTIVELTKSGATVALVNETGIAGWINSEAGRRELADLSVQARFAVVLARRLQDPLLELLKIDPRHLGLGVEKSLVSKANLKRVIESTLESCVALVGVDANDGPEHVLRWVPGLGPEAAKKIVEARAQEPFTSRQALVERGILSEVEWRNAIAFLRVRGS
ncbi:MAG: Tex-like N-terminal domain-containing protein, partial [Planctomycetota bacterium]